MRLDTIIRNGTIVTARLGLRTVGRRFALFLYCLMFFDTASPGQKPPGSSDPPEMLVTEQGFLAIDTPRGWVRSDGPGFAFFIPSTRSKKQTQVWIYISSAPIGPKEEAKDLKSYIESDIASFKQKFKLGLVQGEPALSLPNAKLEAIVYTFRSGEKHNTVEQVIYVAESNRVLTLVLSAREESAFEGALPVFREFAKSYRGSITPTSGPIGPWPWANPCASGRSYAL
jgi:hypothetical protein